MIIIKLYQNGFEINGHANPVICGEVSILAWNAANIIGRVDDTADYWSSKAYNPENPMQGYTRMTFNPDNEKAKWLFDQFKYNAKYWGKYCWPIDQVKFEELEECLQLLNHQ